MEKANRSIATTSLTLALLALSTGVAAQSVLPGGSGGNVGQSPDNSGTPIQSGRGSVDDADLVDITARIETAKDIFFTGDALEIGVSFPRGAASVNDRQVDAYLVIFAPTATQTPDPNNESSLPAGDDQEEEDTLAAEDLGPGSSDTLTDAIIVPVDNASATVQSLFFIDAVDVDSITPGTYQLGVVLTDPGGDPLNMNDWYRGLLGLVDVVGLTITAEALPIDADGDGNIDNDLDNDGFVDGGSSPSQ